MISNVGMQDKVIRLVIGLFFIVLGLNTGITSFWGFVVFLVGLIAAVTGSIGFCPLYKVIGLNSCKSE